MTRRLLHLAVVLVFLLAPYSAQGQSTDEKISSIQKQLESLSDSLKQAFSDLGSIDEGLKKGFTEVQKDMKKLDGRVKDLEDNKMDAQLKLENTVARIDTLEKLLKQLATDVQDIQRKLPTITSSSPVGIMDDLKQRVSSMEKQLTEIKSGSRVAMSPPSTGRIVLVNGYLEELLFIVNGDAYRVPPGAQMPLEGRPAGVFTYEVVSPTFGLRARNTRTLNPNETFTITAR